jgi:hypothetical protein
VARLSLRTPLQKEIFALPVRVLVMAVTGLVVVLYPYRVVLSS